MTTAMGAAQPRILVLGANGKTGSRVAARLERLGLPVRRGSRTASPRFDWEDGASWEDVLTGIDAVYASFQPDLCVPGAIDTLTRFFAAAQAAGVGRVVLLSGRGEPEAEAAEQVLRDTALDWTIIRASWFFQNFSEGFFLDDLLRGALALPEGLADEPFVDAEDIADIAVAALTTDGHRGALYEVTGPQAIGFRDAVAEIAEASRRPIAYIPVSVEAYGAALADAGVPPDVAGLILYLFTTVLDGRNTPVTTGVARALGRPPVAFADYVARTAANGVWSAR